MKHNLLNYSSFTILAAISSNMVFAAATPLGSPSIRIVSLLTSSGGMMIEVPVSVLMRFTTVSGRGQRWEEKDKEAEEEKWQNGERE